MKVRLFRRNEEGERELQGYFTAQDGRVVFCAWSGAGLECLPQRIKEAEGWLPNGESTLSDNEFIASFGDRYVVTVNKRGRTVECSMNDPESYLKYLGYRYADNPWVEVSKGRRRRCPRCDSYKVVRIIHGHPCAPPEDEDSDDWRNTQVLGGCIGMPFRPKWACTDCEEQFGWHFA